MENNASFCYFQFITNEEIIREFSALPSEARREVADFIAFLRMRYSREKEQLTEEILSDESFFGIWKDREDLADAASWVRQNRADQWAK